VEDRAGEKQFTSFNWYLLTTIKMGLHLKRITSSSRTSNTGSAGSTGDTGSNDRNSEPAHARSGSPRFTKADLGILFPLGPEQDAYVRLWDRLYVPRLLGWAGAQEDPFGTNGGMSTLFKKDDTFDATVFASIWSEVYPRVEIEDDGVNILRSIVRPLSQDSGSQRY